MRASGAWSLRDAPDRPTLGYPRPFNYRRAIDALEARQEARIRLGLDRIRRHLKALGDPQDAYASIHVAGTNGKGSVCAMLDSVLRAAGYRVGLYTSPHLQDVRERIRVDGAKIPERDFARLVARTLRQDSSRSLTYFELLTSVAFQCFRERRVEVAVLETGLGGRLDATNVARHPLATVITTVDFDHMGYLGSTLPSIAREKAGILKPGSPALCGEAKPAALSVIRSLAETVGAPLSVLARKASWKGRLGLAAAAQPRNAALVRGTVLALRRAGWDVPDAALRRGLARVRWPGRFEIVRRGGRTVILDGAHNVEAMRHFVRTLARSRFGRSDPVFVLGMLADKEHEAMVRVLAPRLGRVVVTAPPSPRALDPVTLAKEVRRAASDARVDTVPSSAAAIQAALGLEERVVCILGSFYLVGLARKVLGLP